MLKCLSVLVLGIVARSSADNASIACCSPGKFVSYKMRKCWTPNSNDTATLRLNCDNIFRVTNFNINSEGNIEIEIPNLPPKIIGPDL